MPGTKAGAQKIWEKRRARGDNDPEFYRELSNKRKNNVGGFGADPELARKVKQEYWAKKKAEDEAAKAAVAKPKSRLSKIVGIFRGA